MERFERFRFSVPAVPLQKRLFCVSAQLNRKGRFRFRFPENGSGSSGSAFGFGKNGSDGSVPGSGSVPESPCYNVCPQYFFCFTPPPGKGPKNEESVENASSILTHFLGGGGGGMQFISCTISAVPSIPGTAPGVTPRIVGLAFLSQVIRRHSQNQFLNSESGSENTPGMTGNSPKLQALSFHAGSFEPHLSAQIAVFWSRTRKQNP